METLAVGAVFCGVRRGADLAAHYASADLFLFPSLTETFGNVLLEAMACGLATIAFDCAAAAMLVRHGTDGFKVPLPSRVGDDSFLGVVRQATALPVGELRRIGRRAAEVARGQTWGRIVEDFEKELAAVR
jgi:glycosyltransferase involved in cell wall biosynthesis